MTAKKKNKAAEEDEPSDAQAILIIVAFLFIPMLIYVVYRIYTSERHLIPVGVLAIIAGVFFEGKRLSEKWSPVIYTALGAFVFSFLAFLPGKREHNYDFEDHIALWPYWFIFIFAIISIAFHGNKIIPRLTEGITLLQSIAVIYWVVDFGLFNLDGWIKKSVVMIALIPSFYSIFHAFTHTPLSRENRLRLSIWSSVVLMLFAVDNIYRVYQNEQIENTADMTHGLYVGLQFFLLGVSVIYIVQNFLMLAGFLPGKDRFFNDQYYHELAQLKNDHINRYSDRQVSILHSFFCVLFTVTIFAINYFFQILPRHVAIWTVFVVFPFVLTFFEKAMGKPLVEVKQRK